jgi:1-acyl-sn-glycerol-3-phosphate acyltransferase
VFGTFYAVLRWRSLNINRDYGHLFGWGVLKIAGIQLEIENHHLLEASQPCVYVANHQSAFDLAIFGAIFPEKTVIIGKKELILIPFFGLLYVAAGNIRVDRRRSVKAVAGLTQAVNEIRERGASVWIFPEGTRNQGGNELLSFKRGAFHLAQQARVPICPIVAAPLFPRFSWKEKRITRGVLKIRVLDPIYADSSGSLEVDHLMEKTYSKMLEAIRGLAT